MANKLWITEDAFSAIVTLSSRGAKVVQDSTCDGICFEKSTGFNVSDLLHVAINHPMSVVSYASGLDFIRDPRIVGPNYGK
jgi:hypothetical protein